MKSDNVLHTKLIDLDVINKEYLNESVESISNQSAFILNTFIDSRVSNETEFKLLDGSSHTQFPLDKLINVSERYLNGFVNARGGTLWFGINSSGRVIGQNLYEHSSRSIVDEIQFKICERLREWKPLRYTQKVINSVKISVIDLIKIDDEEKVGYVIPNKKVFKISIDPIENVIFSSSKMNNFVVYIRQLNSLCAYTDKTLQHQIGKRQIDKLNKKGVDMDEDDESDIDFGDNEDDKGWIDVNALREGLQCDVNSNVGYRKRIGKLFQDIHNALPV